MDQKVKVIGMRSWYDDAKDKWSSKDIFMDRKYEAPSHQYLFNSLESILASIPRSEHYNLHYTLNHMPEGAKSKKNFAKYEVVVIDIDLIDQDLKEGYIQAVEEYFSLDRSHFAVIDSGFGLHFLFTLKDPIKTKEELEDLKVSYHAMCDGLYVVLDNLGLISTNVTVPHKQGPQTTNIDKQVFRIGTLRLPGTMNVKFDKEGVKVAERECKFITRTMKPVTLEQIKMGFTNPDEFSNSPINPDKYWNTTDSGYIFEKCAALKHFKEVKGNVSYGQWFNALSVISKFKDVDGIELAHELSKGHPSYSRAETDEMLERVSGAGPHKCSTFEANYPQCKDCPVKCSTPLSLKKRNTLTNEATGFHRKSENGARWVPVYREMMLKTIQDHNYRVIGERAAYRYSEEEKKWIKWDQFEVKAYITEITSSKPGDLVSSQVVNEMTNLIYASNVDPELLTRSTGKINFLNGWAEIKGSEFIFTPHTLDSYKQGFTYCLPFEYDPNATCPAWDEFMDDITLKREGLKLILDQYIGYALSNDDYWEEKALIMKGMGANGKSVLIKVVKSLIGDGNYSIVNMKNLRNAENRTALVGKIANLSDESPRDALQDNEDFKALTSGGEFEYRVLYEGTKRTVNRAKFIFSTNHELHLNDKSTAVGRRLIVVPFDANFNPKQGPMTKPNNPFLVKDLERELSGIFNRSMTAYIKAKAQGGFDIPKESEEILEEMAVASDPILAYIKETVDIAESNKVYMGATYDPYHTGMKPGEICFVSSTQIYDDFLAYCEGEGFQAKFTKINFGRILKNRLLHMIPAAREAGSIAKIVRIGVETHRGYYIAWQPYSKL